jgi:hypothetical protein
MTRRFRLRPISTSGGFAQTIVLPPAAPPPRPEAPGNPACDGVPPPPNLQLGSSSFGDCPEGQLQYFVINFSGDEFYELAAADVCAATAPTTWPLRRLCDNTVLQVPASA